MSVAEIDAARCGDRLSKIGRMMAWQDSDGDGFLSEAEMPGFAGGMLMRLDRDGNGSVSKEEFEAAMAKRGRFHRR